MSEPEAPFAPAPGPGRWFRAPQPVRWSLRRLPSYFTWVWAPYMFYSWFGTWLPFSLGRWMVGYLLGGTALFLLLGLVRLLRESAARARTRRDRALSDRPDGVEEFVAEAAFSAEGRYLGLDRGIVWFEEGLMRFSGGVTSFVLSAHDIIPRGSGDSDVPKDGFLLATQKARAFVRLRPLAGRGMFAFRRRLRRFLRDAEPVRAPRPWPPMAAYGEAEPVVPTLLDGLEAIGAKAARTGIARGVLRKGDGR